MTAGFSDADLFRAEVARIESEIRPGDDGNWWYDDGVGCELFPSIDQARAHAYACALSDVIRRVRVLADEIDAGEHATTGRQFGQGMAHASKLVRAALRGEQR